VIRENDQKQRAEHAGAKVLSYRPQIRGVLIEGNWAFEWNDLEVSYKESQEADWRFARVMWNLDE
jgi:hypothetical protein